MAEKTVSVRLQAITAQYKAQMAQAAAATKTFGTQVSTALGSADKGTATVHRRMGAMSKLGGGLRSALADPFTAMASPAGIATIALVGTAKAAIDFESAWAGVTKTVEGTPEQMAALKDGIMEMANELPASHAEIAAVAEAAGQLGIETDSILGFTRTMLDLGETTNLSAEEAATALARFANITKMPQDRFDNLGSAVVELGNKFESTEAEIVEFGLRIAGAGEIAGLSEAEILAIGTAMSSVGVEAEAGGTAVQKVLLGITEQVETGGDKLEKFAAVAGMSAEQFSAQWRKDPAQAFTAFVEGLGRSGKGAIGILKQLGLTDQRLTRAFMSLASAGDLLSESMDIGTAAMKKNTALSEEAEKRYKTTAAQLEIMANNVRGAAIVVGSELLPAINAVLGPLTEFIALMGEAKTRGDTWLKEQFGEHAEFKFQLLPDFGALARNNPLTKHGMAFLDSLGEDAEEATHFLAAVSGAVADVGTSLADAWAQGSEVEFATGAIKRLDEAFEDAGLSADEFTDAIDRLFGATLTLDETAVRWRDELANLNAAIEENGATLDINTDAGRRNRDAFRGAVEAARDHAVAQVEAGKSTDRASETLDAHINQLADEAVASGISREAVRDYIAQLNLTPKERRTLLEVVDDKAKWKVEQHRARLNNLPDVVTTVLQTAFQSVGNATDRMASGQEVRHAGGVAGTSGPRRLASAMALRGNEVPAILERGEVVWSRAQAASGPHLGVEKALAGLTAALEGSGPHGRPLDLTIDFGDGVAVTRSVNKVNDRTRVLFGGRR